MTTFKELGLSEQALLAVKRLGYTEPTPVQIEAIPLVLKGKDLIAAAKTGTGKTAAFALPGMDRIAHSLQYRFPRILIVTPTRELALQIASVCETIAQISHHRVVTVVGGLSYEPQIEKLKKGVDILIATPGRLMDLMEKEEVNLGDIEILVLDEADRMLDMGFWPSVKKIVSKTPKERQTLLFSATIDRSILDVAGSILNNPSFVDIAQRGETADTVDQFIIKIPQTLKPLLLKSLLTEKGGGRVIVFTRTRSRADSNARRLRRAGFSVEALHSDRSQLQRKRALENFSKGKTAILVATDVLARGIDISDVDYVVNFDLPNLADDYVHRIGRTGRAGEEGFAVSFVSPEQESDLRTIEKFIKHKIPVLELDSFDQTEAENEVAERVNRRAAKKDPEIAAATVDLAKREKRKNKAKSKAKNSEVHKSKVKESASTTTKQKKRTPQSSEGQKKRAPHSSEGQKRTPQGSRIQKKNSPHTTTNHKKKSPDKKATSDLRPGRAHRAALAAKRKK